MEKRTERSEPDRSHVRPPGHPILSDIEGVLLAAGRGERLRPLTDTSAKPALVVGDRPLGAYGLGLLSQLGAPVAVNVSWRAEETRAALEPWAPDGTVWLVESPEPYGTAGTLAFLLDRLAPTFVVVNADTITDLHLSDLLATHRHLGAPATVAVVQVDSGADLELSGGHALRFIDRRAEPGAPGALNIGVAAFERDAIAPLLEPGRVAGIGEALLRPLVARGDLAVHLHEGLALDVGTPDRLAEARSLMG